MAGSTYPPNPWEVEQETQQAIDNERLCAEGKARTEAEFGEAMLEWQGKGFIHSFPVEQTVIVPKYVATERRNLLGRRVRTTSAVDVSGLEANGLPSPTSEDRDVYNYSRRVGTGILLPGIVKVAMSSWSSDGEGYAQIYAGGSSAKYDGYIAGVLTVDSFFVVAGIEPVFNARKRCIDFAAYQPVNPGLRFVRTADAEVSLLFGAARGLREKLAN